MAKKANRSLVSDLKVLVYGTIALLSGKGTSPLGDIDHQHNLDSNHGLKVSPPDKQEEHRQDAHKSVKRRINTLSKHLTISVIWLGTAVCIALLTERHAGSVADSNYLGIWSALSFGVATLGRLGWSEQSFSGDSAVERYDRGLFWLLYWVGMFIATWVVMP